MKVNDLMRFPHPVLWERTNDYVGCRFQIDLRIVEAIDSGQLTLHYSVQLDEPAIRTLLESRQAGIGLVVTCAETYYNRLIPVSYAGGMTEVPAGYLRGRVVLRPIIWAIDAIDTFKSPNIHAEFGAMDTRFPKGAVLALGDECVLNVGREKLVNMESIFALSKNDGVPEDQILVEIEEEKIRIVTPELTFQKLTALRGTADGRAFLLNSVYLPAVMEVLASIRDDGERHKEKRWYRIFSAKLEHLGINTSSGSYLQGAQQLLKSPLGRITGHIDLKAL